MSGIPHIYGSDILPRIIDDAKLNLAWSRERGHLAAQSDVHVTVADATQPLPLDESSIDAIVTEGYLGTPLHGDEETYELEREAGQVQQLWIDCLPNLVRVLKTNGTVIATLLQNQTIAL
jgi:tRNA G10  N-methylase Trm11